MQIYSQFNKNTINPLCNDSILVIGYFDGLHQGHKKIFDIAKQLTQPSQKLCVFTFKSTQVMPKFKGDVKHILTDEEKFHLFEKMGVDVCFCPNFDDVYNLETEECVDLIFNQLLGAKAIVVGTDFRFGKNAEGDIHTLKSLCENYEIKTKIVDKLAIDDKIISSTIIRQFIKNGDIKNANKFLGYEFFFYSPVITGNKIGKALLNFPTINQEIYSYKIHPPFGVYISHVYFDDKIFCGVTNIGVKPTVGSKVPLCETFIIGFDDDIYGKIVKISLIKKIRAERKFESLEQLKQQIKKDTMFAENFYENEK